MFQATFYKFVFLVLIASVLFVFLMVRVFRVRVREYPINVEREWRDWRPANPFRFPWQQQPMRDAQRGRHVKKE